MGGWTGFGIRQAAGFAIPMGFMRFSRGMESEADLLGLQYMYKTGYDPSGMVDFFEKLLAEVNRNGKDRSAGDAYLTSDTGKVYTMLAHASGRFG